jgi:hypothetical protein
MTSNDTDIIIYQSGDGKVKIDVRMQGETLWLSKNQMSDLFGRDRSVIGKHIKNIFAEGELDEKSNVQNLHIPNSDKPVMYTKVNWLGCDVDELSDVERYAETD